MGNLLTQRHSDHGEDSHVEQSGKLNEFEEVLVRVPTDLNPDRPRAQAGIFRLERRRVRKNSTSRPERETHRNEAGPVPTQAMTWLWSLLTKAWGFFTQQHITTGSERQQESRITGAQMVVDDQEDFED